MNDRDLDAEFERIIAGWDGEVTGPDLASNSDDPGSAPAVDDAPVDPSADATDAAKGEPDPASPPAPRSGPAAIDLPIAPTAGHVWRGPEPTVDDVESLLEAVGDDHPVHEDHFVPPDTDLPTAEDDPMFWAIVGGLAGGPLLLLYVVLFDRGGSGWWVVIAVTMIVVGFALLVLRGGTERDPFDDGTRI